MKIQVKGIHHITLRVNDMERSRRFYQDVLGFDVVQATDDLCYFQVGLTLVALRPPLEGTSAGDRFSEYRIGVDHMAFAVEERGELDKVVRVLREAGVHTEGVELDPTLNKEYVCFRDPDNVQWEFYMMHSGGAARRRAQLHALGRAYVTEGFAKKNFDAIPYDDNVTLRAPLTPGGSDVPLVGKENLHGFWWVPLPKIMGDARVIGTYVNEDMTAVTCEFLLDILDPPCILHVLDRFTVNAEGKIIAQENYFDPRDVTNPGWREAFTKQRRAQLHAIGRAYVTEGLAKKNFDAIPYHDNVSLRAPLCPGGSLVPLVGKENLRRIWWAPLPRLMGDAHVIDTYIDEELSTVTCEFLLDIVDPPTTLRLLDRFTVDFAGRITAQENYFDPRNVTNPGWQQATA